MPCSPEISERCWGFAVLGRDWTTGYLPVCSSPHEFQVLASGIVGGGDVSREDSRTDLCAGRSTTDGGTGATGRGLRCQSSIRSIENTR